MSTPSPTNPTLRLTLALPPPVILNRVGFTLSAGLPEYGRFQTPSYIAQQLGLTVGR